MKERTKLLIIVLTFVAAYYIPWANETIRQSGLEAFMMLQEYAREHVLTCLIPAFFIAGAIAVFYPRHRSSNISGLKQTRFCPIQWLQSLGRSWRSAPVQYFLYLQGSTPVAPELVRQPPFSIPVRP